MRCTVQMTAKDNKVSTIITLLRFIVCSFDSLCIALCYVTTDGLGIYHMREDTTLDFSSFQSDDI